MWEAGLADILFPPPPSDIKGRGVDYTYPTGPSAILQHEDCLLIKDDKKIESIVSQHNIQNIQETVDKNHIPRTRR